MITFSRDLTSGHPTTPVKFNWSVFARTMHSTSEFAKMFLSKCVVCVVGASIVGVFEGCEARTKHRWSALRHQGPPMRSMYKMPPRILAIGLCSRGLCVTLWHHSIFLRGVQGSTWPESCCFCTKAQEALGLTAGVLYCKIVCWCVLQYKETELPWIA